MEEYLDERKAVIDTCLGMNAAGINQNMSGNVSVRTQDGFLITASGIAYESMRPEHVVPMTLAGGYRGEFLPSSEWRMHRDIYAARAGAGAIVHTHSRHATALSCLRLEIPPFHYMIAVCGGSTIRCAKYATFGTEALSANMLTALEGRNACLLANHGMICYSDGLAGALRLAVEIESICAQYLAAISAGEPVLLDDSEMQLVLDRIGAYGKQLTELKRGQGPAFVPPERLD